MTGTLVDREQWTKGQFEIIGTVLRFWRWRSLSRKTVKQCWQTKDKEADCRQNADFKNCFLVCGAFGSWINLLTNVKFLLKLDMC